MGVTELKLGTLVLPRSESPRAVSRLAEFEWFHKIDSRDELVTPELDDLLLEAQKAFQTIDEVAAGLGVPERVGILEILFKGMAHKRRDYPLSEIEGMVRDIKEKMSASVGKASELLKDLAQTDRLREEYAALLAGLGAASSLGVDLGGFGTMRHFYADVFVISAPDYDEIARSLDHATTMRLELDSKDHAAILIVCAARDSERTLRVMRSYGASPFRIPTGFPQVPSKAHALATSKLEELALKRKEISSTLARIAKSKRAEISALREAAMVAKDVLETLRKPGGTRNFAMIRGYIPARMASKFSSTFSQWTALVEDIRDEKLVAAAPTLLDNRRFVRTFEHITRSQGIPRRGEPDPTPMIALVWPIFYGIMFADIGHGLLLMGLGLLFSLKGQGGLSRWGMLIAISGASAGIAGVGTGEVFGFHVDHLAPFEELLHEGGALYSISWLVGAISVAELTFDQVIDILKVSLFIGIIHLVAAMILRIRQYIRAGKKIAAYMEALPNLVLYGSIVVIMMCAIGAEYDVINMYSRAHAEPIPWVTVFLGEWAQVWIITRIAVVLAISSMAVMMVGGILHAKRHPEEGGGAAAVIMEVLLGKTIESLAHTISYARIGIMLLVHAALLLTVNSAFASLGGVESPAALALLVGGNIGIMMIEGLIVYIQSLRLHLYEYFTKWYAGGAPEFRGVIPETVYNRLAWGRAR